MGYLYSRGKCAPKTKFIVVSQAKMWIYNQTLLCISNPPSGSWKGAKLNYNFNNFTLAVAGMSIVFDVMVLCFPLPVIRTLHMPTRRKIQIGAVFWLGGLYVTPSPMRRIPLSPANVSAAVVLPPRYVYTTSIRVIT